LLCEREEARAGRRRRERSAAACKGERDRGLGCSRASTGSRRSGRCTRAARSPDYTCERQREEPMTQPTGPRAASSRQTSSQTRALRMLIVLACMFAAALGVGLPLGAHSQERNFAGSMQTNYQYVPTDTKARRQTFDGFTNELSLKVAVDF